MASPLEIITNALSDHNLTSNGALAPEDLDVGLSHYNRLIGRWSANPKMSYYTRTQAFAWTTSKQSYTLGPTGADFTFSGGVRPPKISRAKLVITSTTPASELELPVILLDAYASVPNPAQSGTQPYCIYYQPTFPNGTIWPVPYPTTTSNQLRLFWPAQLERIALADVATDIDMPPALEDALTWTLEERLAIPFGYEVTAELKAEAHGARQAYRQLNDADPAFIATALRGQDSAVDVYWMQSRGH